MEGVNSSSLFSVNSSPTSNPTVDGKPTIVKTESVPIISSSVSSGAVAAMMMMPPASSIAPSSNTKGANMTSSVTTERKVLDKRRLGDLVKEVDPLLQLDDDVEEMILQIADDFIDNAVSSACELAKHRKSNTLETKDLHVILERNYNMWVPGLGTDDIRPYKKAHLTEAHKQRVALIKKTMKKF